MMDNSHPVVTSDRSVTGVLLAFGAFALFAFSDACVKLVEGQLSPYESAFFGAVFALAVIPMLRQPGDRMFDVFRCNNRKLWWLLFVAYPIGVIGSVTSFTYLSMAEAFVLIFLQPAYVTIASVFFLKEKVGVRRWAAVIIGFIGVLIVLRPGFRELSIGHFGAVFAGLSGAIFVLAFRVANKSEKKISLFGAGVVGGICICGLAMIPYFQMPTIEEWGLLAGYGLFAAFANWLIMQAAQHAPATYISTTQYSQMIWAVILGYWLFGDHVDAPMMAGIVLIIASGMMTLIRERQRGTPLPPAIAAVDGNASLALVDAETQDKG